MKTFSLVLEYLFYPCQSDILVKQTVRMHMCTKEGKTCCLYLGLALYFLGKHDILFPQILI